MKFRKIWILAISLSAIMAFTGCEKDDGPIPSRISIEDVPTMTTNVDATGSTSIAFTNQAAFAGKFKVDLYFPGAKPPDKIDVVVRKFNGTTANNSNVRVFKTNVTSFPANYTITVADIVGLFGTPLTLGDTYDFAPNTYVGTKIYEALPAVGSGTGVGHNGSPGFSEFARYRAL